LKTKRCADFKDVIYAKKIDYYFDKNVDDDIQQNKNFDISGYIITIMNLNNKSLSTLNASTSFKFNYNILKMINDNIENMLTVKRDIRNIFCNAAKNVDIGKHLNDIKETIIEVIDLYIDGMLILYKNIEHVFNKIGKNTNNIKNIIICDVNQYIDNIYMLYKYVEYKLNNTSNENIKELIKTIY